MSVLTFTLTDDHIKLIRNLRWDITKDKYIISSEDYLDNVPIFGTDTVYEAVDLILNGKPEEFDPLISFNDKTFSDEQIAEWDKLISELPTALDIILYNGNFETGTYKSKYHIRDWTKI
jgi:DNA polymerase III delta subunit